MGEAGSPKGVGASSLVIHGSVHSGWLDTSSSWATPGCAHCWVYFTVYLKGPVSETQIFPPPFHSLNGHISQVWAGLGPDQNSIRV